MADFGLISGPLAAGAATSAAAAGGTAAAAAGTTALASTAGGLASSLGVAAVPGGIVNAMAGSATMAGGLGTVSLPMAGAAAGGGLGLGSVMSLASSAFDLIGGVMEGNQQDAYYRARAEQSQFNARQALLQGMQSENAIREQMLKTLAAQRAAFGAAGVDLSSGTPQDVQQQTIEEANRQLSTESANARIQAAGDNWQADLYRSTGRSKANSAYLGGAFSAGKGLFDFVDKVAEIG